MVTAAEFIDIATIFSPSGLHPVSSTRIDKFLDLAEQRVAREMFSDAADQAVIFMAAHLLTEDIQMNTTAIGAAAGPTSSGYAGPITSEAMGPLSRSFGGRVSGVAGAGGDSRFADEALATTGWGKKFVALREEKVLGAAVADGV